MAGCRSRCWLAYCSQENSLGGDKLSRQLRSTVARLIHWSKQRQQNDASLAIAKRDSRYNSLRWWLSVSAAAIAWSPPQATNSRWRPPLSPPGQNCVGTTPTQAFDYWNFLATVEWVNFCIVASGSTLTQQQFHQKRTIAAEFSEGKEVTKRERRKAPEGEERKQKGSKREGNVAPSTVISRRRRPCWSVVGGWTHWTVQPCPVEWRHNECSGHSLCVRGMHRR